MTPRRALPGAGPSGSRRRSGSRSEDLPPLEVCYRDSHFLVEVERGASGLERGIWLWWQAPEGYSGKRSPTRKSYAVSIWYSVGAGGALARAVRRIRGQVFKTKQRQRRELEADAWVAVLDGWTGTGASVKRNPRGLLPLLRRRSEAWDARLRQEPRGAEMVRMEIGLFLRQGLTRVFGVEAPRSAVPSEFVATALVLLESWGVPAGRLGPRARPLLLAELAVVLRLRQKLLEGWDYVVDQAWREPDGEPPPAWVREVVGPFLDSVLVKPGDELTEVVEALRAGPWSEWSPHILARLLLGLIFESDWEGACSSLDANGQVDDLAPARAMAEAVAAIVEREAVPFRLQAASLPAAVRRELMDRGHLLRPELYGALVLRDAGAEARPPLDRLGLRRRLERLARDIATHGQPAWVPGGDAASELDQHAAVLAWLYDLVDWRKGLVLELAPALGDALWRELCSLLRDPDVDRTLLELRGVEPGDGDLGPQLVALMTARRAGPYRQWKHPEGCPSRGARHGSHYWNCLHLSWVTEVWERLGLSQILLRDDSDPLDAAEELPPADRQSAGPHAPFEDGWDAGFDGEC